MAAEKIPEDRPLHEEKRGVYGISVVAEMVGTGVQNLRLYERKGLLAPTRSPGGTRLYSRLDVHRLTRITKLLADGLNLAGIAMVLDLQDDNTRLRDHAAAGSEPDKRHRHLPSRGPDQLRPDLDGAVNPGL